MTRRRPIGRLFLVLAAVFATLALAQPAPAQLGRPGGARPSAATHHPLVPAPPTRPRPLWSPRPPLRTPTAAEPLRVLLLGDGVMFDAAPAIEAALASTGAVSITTRPVLGFGLTRPEWDDWRARWPVLVAAERPELVVVLVGPWDIRTLHVAGEDLVPGTAAWDSWYRGLASGAARLLRAGGAHLIWLGMPWNEDPATWPRTAALNEVIRAVAGSGFVDLAAILAGPAGGYQAVQTVDGDGAARIMKPDGVHLCPAGAERVAGAVLVAASRLWRVNPRSSWRDGAWRSEARYSWAPGGGCPSA